MLKGEDLFKGRKYGPDDKNGIDIDRCGLPILTAEKGKKLHCSFTAEADWEQAMCIYSVVNGTLTKVAERGTYKPRRNLDDWVSPINESDQPVDYYITAWHKKGSPSADKPWYQNEMGSIRSDPYNSWGSEDSPSDPLTDDYNDIVIHFQTL